MNNAQNNDDFFDGFENVQRGGTTWEPKSTGKKKDGTLKSLPADDKSFIVGYYMGTEDGKGPKGNSTVHYLKLYRRGGNPMVGDMKHFSNNPAETDDNISIWGTGVLNVRIAENVKLGQCIMVKWLGITPSKKAGGESYHNWEVKVNTKIDPMSVSVQQFNNDLSSEFIDDDAPLNGVVASEVAPTDFDDDDAF